VQIITIAYGANADVESLRLISKTTGGLAYVSRDPKDILRVFTDAISKLPTG
jgi:Ca-activated chloride channel family protein